jgi:hypothetical protein
MKKRVLIALGVLAILALLTAPAFAGGGGRARAGASHYTFYHSGDFLPVPPYGTIDIEGSSGKLIVNQPEGEVSVVFTANFDGLLPSRTYKVYIMNYTCPGASGWSHDHYGCWTCVGNFTTDAYGHGDYHQNIWAGDLGLGTYNLSIWINDAGYGKTLLISDNFQVVIE